LGTHKHLMHRHLEQLGLNGNQEHGSEISIPSGVNLRQRRNSSGFLLGMLSVEKIDE
jgi:hypothetical protein